MKGTLAPNHKIKFQLCEHFHKTAEKVLRGLEG